MRLNVNLASQPYLDARRFLWRWGIVLLVLSLLTIGLVYAAVTQLLAWQDTRKAAGQLQAQIAEQDRVRSRAQAYLNQPQNSGTRDQSRFINGLLARKAFSWTQALSELERIMPARLRVVNLRPTIGDNEQLMVQLTVQGDSRDYAVELVRRLENSPRFRWAAIDSEATTSGETGRSNLVTFSISAVYVPETARQGGQ